MKYKKIAKRILELKNADLAMRDRLIREGKLSESYHEEMQALHIINATLLNDIINTIGYPTIDKVGNEASEAAWLIIQHAISQPEFMKKCEVLLEKAVNERNADPKTLAYLRDRIAVLEDKSQLFGTQFDWDENGTLSPAQCDNYTKVNERRRSIGLNTLEEQIENSRKRAEEEKQSPPADLERRKQEVKEWKKRVGWTK